jgi:hypothetical protein
MVILTLFGIVDTINGDNIICNFCPDEKKTEHKLQTCHQQYMIKYNTTSKIIHKPYTNTGFKIKVNNTNNTNVNNNNNTNVNNNNNNNNTNNPDVKIGHTLKLNVKTKWYQFTDKKNNLHCGWIIILKKVSPIDYIVLY